MGAQELLSKNLPLLRKERQLKQTDLAKLAGITRKHLCSIEKGRTFPSATIMDQLASALEVPVERLFHDPELIPQNQMADKFDKILDHFMTEVKEAVRKI